MENETMVEYSIVKKDVENKQINRQLFPQTTLGAKTMFS